MCGRYYVDDELADGIEGLLEELNLDTNHSLGYKTERSVRPVTGDICPSEQSVVLVGTATGIEAEVKRWGFPGREGKGLVINARSETVLEKPMFRESVLHRRCVIPASGFYEWNKAKEKVTFSLPGRRMVFLAGFYRRFPETEEDRYVILTTEANPWMEPVHPRMPLILGREQIQAWLKEDEAVGRLLATEPGELRRKAEYEQMNLDLFL